MKSMPFPRLGICLGLLFGLAAAASAQTTPFSLLYQFGGTTTTLSNGASLTLVASAGQVQTLQIRATYTGSGRATISQNPIVIGTSTLSATVDQALPVRLDPGQFFTFTVRYAPVSSASSSGALSLAFSEDPNSGGSPIALNLQGLSSALALSYVLPADQNVVPIGDNTTIPFPDTLAGGSAVAGLNITNLGSGPGQITSIDVTGTAFRLQNKPLLPATIPSGQNVQVQIIYRPTAQTNDTGTVTIGIGGSAPVTVNLAGRGVLSQLTYQALNPDTSISPGDTITLPNIEPGQTSTRLFRISNTGSAPATISQLSATGQGFQLGGPVTLPITIQPGSNSTITLSFTPTHGGTSNGTLLVNSDVFALSGAGLAPQLTYSYVVAGSVLTVTPGSPINFSPVQVTSSSAISLTIKNTGTSAAVISNVGITTSGTAFSIAPAPALPATIPANGSLNVSVRFEPVTVGVAGATLTIDGATFPLSGSGTQPPALPAYTITAPSGSTSPFSQPVVSLKLASPYPTALTGTLTLGVASGALPADPAVQFATGGRTVIFRIPANSTDAIFGTATSPAGTQVGLQTGTVAGTFTLTPSFATQAGSFDLTPANPTTAQFNIAGAAPSILNVRILNATANSLSVEVTGYTTTRSLTSLTIDFQTAPKFSMPTSSFTINLGAASAGWFQSTSSQSFGGQFRVTVPFTFQLPANQSVLTGIKSLAATIANGSGNSQKLEMPLQ